VLVFSEPSLDDAVFSILSLDVGFPAAAFAELVTFSAGVEELDGFEVFSVLLAEGVAADEFDFFWVSLADDV